MVPSLRNKVTDRRGIQTKGRLILGEIPHQVIRGLDRGQIRAIRESIRSDRDDAIWQRDVGECGASGEGIQADRGHSIWNHNAGDIRVVLECPVPDRCDG